MILFRDCGVVVDGKERGRSLKGGRLEVSIEKAQKLRGYARGVASRPLSKIGKRE